MINPISLSSSRGITNLIPITFNYPSHFNNESIKKFKKLLPKSNIVIYFDTETTGLSNVDNIIEITFIKRNYKDMKQTSFYSLINPNGRKSNIYAYNVH